jgi:hypothetical protein
MDPQQQQNMAGMMAGFGLIFLLISVVIYAILVFLFWRIFTKAGMAGPMALIAIIPGIGPLIVLCILAFGECKVVPVAAIAYPPAYPPSYPPTV